MSVLNRIVWISEAIKAFSDEELLALLTKSRANNIRKNVTGLLLYDDMSFLQMMEGDAKSVDQIFEERIKPSRLHRNVTLLSRNPIEERIFKNWTMGFYSANNNILHKIPGFKDFRKTYASFLDLRKDDDMVVKLVRGFQEGRWHLGEPLTNPNPTTV